MKFDFWFELPKALCNITQDTLNSEEVNLCNVLEKSHKVLIFFILGIS